MTDELYIDLSIEIEAVYISILEKGSTILPLDWAQLNADCEAACASCGTTMKSTNANGSNALIGSKSGWQESRSRFFSRIEKEAAAIREPFGAAVLLGAT